MPEIVSGDGEIHPLSYIEVEGKSRPRYVSVLRVANAWPGNHGIWAIPEFEAEQGTEGLEIGRMVFSVEDEIKIDANWVAEKIATYTVHSTRKAVV